MKYPEEKLSVLKVLNFSSGGSTGDFWDFFRNIGEVGDSFPESKGEKTLSGMSLESGLIL